MNDKFIRYDGFKDITPAGLDGKTHRFNFVMGDVTDGNLDSFSISDQFFLDIGISGTLQSVWGIAPFDVPACSGTLAVNQVITSGGNPKITNLVYTTDNAPEFPPDRMNVNSPNQFIKLETKPEPIKMSQDFHASIAAKNIAELRDNINALFKDITGDKILRIESERSLIDIYYPANSLETFSSRLSALANLVTLINTDHLKNLMKDKKIEDGGSIFILEQYLKNRDSKFLISDICQPLYNINNLRQCFPIHHDIAGKVIKAFDYFKIRYPIEDFSVAWDVIIGKYILSLNAFLKLLQIIKYGG